jgi:carboxynorspermidine decarboxylase
MPRGRQKERPAPMETRAGDPGAFAHFDLSRVDSPAFVVDVQALRRNLATLADIRDRAGIKILAALKAFSMWQVAPVVGEYLDGVCTSGLWEAKLADEHYQGEIATYCAAYKAEDLPEICALSDHVIFNSPFQIARFKPVLDAARAAGHAFDVGLRINPLHQEGEVPRYDPCAPHSRLGFPVDQLQPEHLEGVSGLHFHTLCEQDFEPLRRTWEALLPRIAPFLGQLKWLNFGGGHHVTRADYQRDDLVAFLRGEGADRLRALSGTGRGGCARCRHPGGHRARSSLERDGHCHHRHFRHLPHARRDRGALSPGHAGGTADRRI